MTKSKLLFTVQCYQTGYCVFPSISYIPTYIDVCVYNSGFKKSTLKMVAKNNKIIFPGFLATMVVIAFFALDQLLREMPYTAHSKLT